MRLNHLRVITTTKLLFIAVLCIIVSYKRRFSWNKRFCWYAVVTIDFRKPPKIFTIKKIIGNILTLPPNTLQVSPWLWNPITLPSPPHSHSHSLWIIRVQRNETLKQLSRSSGQLWLRLRRRYSAMSSQNAGLWRGQGQTLKLFFAKLPAKF